MDKIKLSVSDIEFILRWRDEHPDLVRFGRCPLKAVKLICFETGHIITAVREEKRLTLGVSHNGKRLGKLTFELLFGGFWKLTKDTTKLTDENRQAVLTVYASTMALLLFGQATLTDETPEPETRELLPSRTHSPGQPRRKSRTYILRRNGEHPARSARGHHASPRYAFSVRGHYRHYKSGKVVWIAEHTRGKGDRKDKTYVVGLQTETNPNI